MYLETRTRKSLLRVLHISNNEKGVSSMKVTKLVLSAVSLAVSAAMLTMSIIDMIKTEY